MCVTGRLNRTTTWVPFEKTQSVRRIQGPLQRPLGLATVHVDVAGKRARAEFRDREEAEADRLVEELTTLSRAARLRRPARAGDVGPGVDADADADTHAAGAGQGSVATTAAAQARVPPSG
jgi:putative membrane protein